MVNFVKFTLLALFSVRSVPFSLGSQNNVECESVGFVFPTISLCDVYLGADFLHSCWMLHVLLKHQTVVYDVPKGKNLDLVSTLASYFRDPKVKT